MAQQQYHYLRKIRSSVQKLHVTNSISFHISCKLQSVDRVMKHFRDDRKQFVRNYFESHMVN
jgi:hypothetical protein